MSVLYPSDRGEWWAPPILSCCHCGEGFAPDEPVVFWSQVSDMVLHADCAQYLGPHLIADAREAQLASKQGWGRRAARAAGAALRAEEARE